jgi:hypothetical protein
MLVFLNIIVSYLIQGSYINNSFFLTDNFAVTCCCVRLFGLTLHILCSNIGLGQYVAVKILS